MSLTLPTWVVPGIWEVSQQISMTSASPSNEIGEKTNGERGMKKWKGETEVSREREEKDWVNLK